MKILVTGATGFVGSHAPEVPMRTSGVELPQRQKAPMRMAVEARPWTGKT